MTCMSRVIRLTRAFNYSGRDAGFQELKNWLMVDWPSQAVDWEALHLQNEVTTKNACLVIAKVQNRISKTSSFNSIIRQTLHTMQ